MWFKFVTRREEVFSDRSRGDGVGTWSSEGRMEESLKWKSVKVQPLQFRQLKHQARQYHSFFLGPCSKVLSTCPVDEHFRRFNCLWKLTSSKSSIFSHQTARGNCINCQSLKDFRTRSSRFLYKNDFALARPRNRLPPAIKLHNGWNAEHIFALQLTCHRWNSTFNCFATIRAGNPSLWISFLRKQLLCCYEKRITKASLSFHFRFTFDLKMLFDSRYSLIVI